MIRRKVDFTRLASDQLRAAKTWWIDNERPVGILADEIEQAVSFLSLLPGAGTPYHQAEIAGLRRLYLRRLSSHLYYTFTRNTVTIRAFWHAKNRLRSRALPGTRIARPKCTRTSEREH